MSISTIKSEDLKGSLVFLIYKVNQMINTISKETSETSMFTSVEI